MQSARLTHPQFLLLCRDSQPFCWRHNTFQRQQRECCSAQKEKKVWPYNHVFLLILSKALARSSYTSICIIQSMDFSIQVSASPSIFWPSRGSSSQIRYTKVHVSKIKQSPNYSPNFYTRVAISLQFVAMSSCVACVTNEVFSIRWSLPVIIYFCSKHITSIWLSADLVLFFQDLGKMSVCYTWQAH